MAGWSFEGEAKMKIQALTRPGLCLSLLLAAGGAWGQASSEAVPPKRAPESLTVPSQSSGVSDSIITARAKAALMGADHVPSGDVHVTTNGGVVTLRGHVASVVEKQAAQSTVQKLDDVTAVRNDLVVDGTAK
jgi:hypothetical protein